MQIFSYIFYTFFKVVDKVGGYDTNACGLLSVFQFINLITFIDVCWGKECLSKPVAVSIGLAIFILNTTVFFNEKTLIKFQKRWDKELVPDMLIKRTLVLLYVVATIAGVVYIVA